MISSLIGFWVLVRAVATGEDGPVHNALLGLSAVGIVLLVVAMWFRGARPYALGAAAGLVAGAGVAGALAVAFGAD